MFFIFSKCDLESKIYNYNNLQFRLAVRLVLFLLVKKRNEKSFQIQAFCEEKDLTLLLGVFWYAESKNQCWQTEKWLLIDLICIFSR